MFCAHSSDPRLSVTVITLQEPGRLAELRGQRQKACSGGEPDLVSQQRGGAASPSVCRHTFLSRSLSPLSLLWDVNTCVLCARDVSQQEGDLRGSPHFHCPKSPSLPGPKLPAFHEFLIPPPPPSCLRRR